jgi:hypothetical protein
MAESRYALAIFGIVAVIALISLVLLKPNGADGYAARPPEFDPATGCFYYPSEDMKGDTATYTCYTSVQGKPVCCLNEYVRPL